MRVPHQVWPHVTTRVPCVGDVPANREDIRLARAENRKPIELPVSQDIVSDSTACLEGLAGTDGKLIDPVHREDMGQVGTGHTAVIIEMVRILNCTVSPLSTDTRHWAM